MQYTLRPIFSFLCGVSFCLMSSAVEPAPHPRFGGQLRHAIFQRVTTLDGVNYLNFAESQVAANLYEGLVKRDRFGRIVSAIAQSWRHSEDYRVWRFTIAQNAKFHDGTPVRAIDIKRAWERSVRESWRGEIERESRMSLFSIEGAVSYRTNATEEIIGIEVLDEKHLRVTLKKGNPEFLAKLTAPMAWITKRGNPQPIGTGRFHVASYSAEEIQLAANANYVWGRPYVDSVIFRYYVDVREALFDFESRGLDALYLPLTEAEKRRRENLNEILIQTDIATGVYLYINLPNTKSQDSGQQAWHNFLKYAVDVDALLRLQYGAEFAQLALAASPYRYNPTKARRRLKHTNEERSRSLRMVYASLPDNTGEEIAMRLKRDFFSHVGLQVANPVEFGGALKDASADIALLAMRLPQNTDGAPSNLYKSDLLIPLYFLPSHFLCQPQVRCINIGWGGIATFDGVWLSQ